MNSPPDDKEEPASDVPGDPPPPVAPAPGGQPPVYAAPGSAPFPPPPEPEPQRPGVGPGVATGCGVQVLALILFFLTAGIIPGFYGALWPFVLFTVGAALLLISWRWRRFATGTLIVCAATW